MLMVINPSIEIYLLDPAGNILAFSAEPGKVRRRRVDLAPLRLWLAGDATIPHFGDDPRNPSGQKVFSLARIPEQGELKGYLYVILGGEEYDSAARKFQGSYILKLSTLMIGAGLLCTLLAGLLFFALLTGRLRRLARAMVAFRGKVTPASAELPLLRETVRPGDEIEHLETVFREMAGRIEQQIEALRKSDTLRRELVANVSHDLRTPLANLQGYMETLLIKDDTMAPAERRRYLQIANKHCERLSKLIADLFELARLDSRAVGVEAESVTARTAVKVLIMCMRAFMASTIWRQRILIGAIRWP